jgi:hypothetical protein
MESLPFRINDTEYSLFVVFEDENIERIREQDPAEVHLPLLGDRWYKELRLRDVIITYANAEDLKTFHDLCMQDKAREAMQFLCRGFRYRPDRGDNDAMYRSLKGK